MRRECSPDREQWGQWPAAPSTHAWIPEHLLPFPAHSIAMILGRNGLHVSDISVWPLHSTSSMSDTDLSDRFGLFIWNLVTTGDIFFVVVATYTPMKNTLTNKCSKGTKTSTLYTQNWAGSSEFSGSRLFGFRQFYLLKNTSLKRTRQNIALWQRKQHEMRDVCEGK